MTIISFGLSPPKANGHSQNPYSYTMLRPVPLSFLSDDSLSKTRIFPFLRVREKTRKTDNSTMGTNYVSRTLYSPVWILFVDIYLLPSYLSSFLELRNYDSNR